MEYQVASPNIAIQLSSLRRTVDVEKMQERGSQLLKVPMAANQGVIYSNPPIDNQMKLLQLCAGGEILLS
jgi:hypothetical protein